MSKPAGPTLAAFLLAAALGVTSAAAPAGAVEPFKPTLSVINTTDRVVFCTLIFDGKARTELAIRPGKTWFESFDPRRRLQLVCQRGKSNAFGPLTPGSTYRLVAAGSKVDIVEEGGE